MDNEKLLKRLQAGTRSYDDANNLHAECYGTIGALEQEVERLRFALDLSDYIIFGQESPEFCQDTCDCVKEELRKALHKEGES